MARIVVATNCNQLQPAETSLFAHCTRSSLTASTTHSHARSPSESTLARAEPGRRSPPDEAAAALGEERGRIVGALEYLDQRGLVELQPAEVRQRYTLLARPDSGAELVDRLLERFARWERAETARIDNVLRSSPTTVARCAHSSPTSGRPARGPVWALQPLLDRTCPGTSPAGAEAADRRERQCRRARGAAHHLPRRARLPRQQARFLAGITSPATSRAKLTKDPLFGSLSDRRFADVLACCEVTVG